MQRVRRWPISGLQWVAVLVLVIWAFEIVTDDGYDGDRTWSLLVVVTIAAALAAGERMAHVPAVVCVTVLPLGDQVNPELLNSGALAIAFVASFYLIGRRTVGRQLVAGLAVLAAALPTFVFWDGEPADPGNWLFAAVFLGGPLLVGWAIRRRVARERVLSKRAVAAERERDAAVAQERLRIARELHDVVAHSLNVIVLQARGARSVLDTAPSDTARALDVIDYLGQQGLVEMRRMLGMLREDDEALALLPQPGLSRLAELADGVTASGMPVEIRFEGSPVVLPPGLDVSAYRIVQEALTNALKHAGPARASVLVGYRPEAIDITVDDDGFGESLSVGGHGLVGMEERVAVYGGTMEFGPRPAGGFRVRVRLPLVPT